jgi:HD-GYP domain-containing protein (c-di-GMP phosphodiesterase class II)
MRLVPIDSVDPGARLARDVWTRSSGTTPLLRAGTPLSGNYRERLTKGGVAAVYVDDELSVGIDTPVGVRPVTQFEATRVLASAFSVLPGKGPSKGRSRADIVHELKRVVRGMIDDLEDNGDQMLAYADLSTVDAYALQHPVDVAVLGLSIGRKLFDEYGWIDYDGTRRFDRIDERLRVLGLGLLLHEIGKATIPPGLLEKKGPLNDGEWELIRTYPAAGAAMLTEETVGARAKSVVRCHQERFDGSGYPAELIGDNIPQPARIAAVADVYDAITSARPYRKAAPASVGVEAIKAGAGTLFDPQVVTIFRMLVAPYPAGTSVTLSDGREGVVAYIPPERAEQPIVRVLADEDGNELEMPIELSLVRHPEITIAGAVLPGASKIKPRPVVELPAEIFVEVPAEAAPRAPTRGLSEIPVVRAPRPQMREQATGGFPADRLTGLATRKQLDADLLKAVLPTAPPSLLVIYDLDGTGLENSRTRVRTETLLRELAARITATLGDVATCYRSREAELSALIYAPIPTAVALVGAAARALGTQDSGAINPIKFGTAILPREANDPLDAIILADKRRKFGHED